jgi:HD-like signal output (HDOD) protein
MAITRAKSTARVMAINQTTLDALSPETQVYFYRKLNDLAALRVEDLSAREVELSSRNQKLVDYIQTARQRGKVDYSESAMIRGIIQKVPRLPGFATTLVTRLLQEDASPSEVAQHIKKDLALSALVIKTVNGPLYDFATKVTDIHQAVMQLGYIGVYQLVLAEGLRRTMPDLPVSRQVMAHGMAVSQLAYGLSLEIASGRPNEAATIGLVHDVGQNVIGLLKTKNPNLAMLIDALDASHLGSMLLTEWNLPEAVGLAVEHQSYPEFAPPDAIPGAVRNIVAVLYLAQIFYDLLKGRKPEDLHLSFLDEYLKLLGGGGQNIEEILQKKLLPVLLKKMGTYPASFRELILTYSRLNPQEG